MSVERLDDPPLAGDERRRPGVEYTDRPNIERHVFLCGLHKSGTTMLEAYLFAHYDLSVLRACVPENEGQHLQSVYSPASSFGGPGRFAFNPKMYEELRSLDDHDGCRDRLTRDWRRYVVGASRTLLEKSPPNLTKIGWLRKVFRDPLFIIIVRDPRAVSVATRKWSKTSLEDLMMHWEVAHSVALNDFAEDCLVVRYEDFCEDQGRALRDSGIDAMFPRRPVPLGVDDRFTRIRELNRGYLVRHRPKRRRTGVWGRFGYEV